MYHFRFIIVYNRRVLQIFEVEKLENNISSLLEEITSRSSNSEAALKQLQLESYELGKKTLEEPLDNDTPNKEPLIIEQIKSFRQSLIIN